VKLSFDLTRNEVYFEVMRNGVLGVLIRLIVELLPDTGIELTVKLNFRRSILVNTHEIHVHLEGFLPSFDSQAYSSY
jgi:hypothetical protein